MDLQVEMRTAMLHAEEPHFKRIKIAKGTEYLDYYSNDCVTWVDFFRNHKNRKIVFYFWKASQKFADAKNDERKVAILVHGYGGHSRFEWLHHSPTDPLQPPQYHNSWIERLNQEGFDVFTFDAEGHGLSDGINSYTCQIDDFDDIPTNIASLLLHIYNLHPYQSLSCSLNFFLCGISMGGGACYRFLQLLSQQGQLAFKGSPANDDTKNFPQNGAVSIFKKLWNILSYDANAVAQQGLDSNKAKVKLRHVTLLSPMLSLEKVKQKLINRIFFPIIEFLANWTPNLALGARQSNEKFPICERYEAEDPLCYKGKVRALFASQVLKAVDSMQADAAQCGQMYNDNDKSMTTYRDTMPQILIVHSRNDTLCEPEGSILIFEKMTMKNESACSAIKLTLLDDMWHWLAKEPGNENIIGTICQEWNENQTKS